MRAHQAPQSSISAQEPKEIPIHSLTGEDAYPDFIYPSQRIIILVIGFMGILIVFQQIIILCY